MSTSTSFFSLTLGILCLGHFFVDIMLSIWPVYKTMAELDLALAGTIAGASAFIGEGLQIFFGSLGDKGYRKALILAGVGLTCSIVFVTYTANYYLLFFLYLTTCIGSGAFHPSGAALMGSLTAHRKGLLISVFVASGAFGMGVGQLLFTQTYDYFNGHALLLALLPLALVGWVLLKPSTFEAPQVYSKTHTSVKECFKLFLDRNLLCLYITQLCNATLFWGTIFLLPDILSVREYDGWMAFGGGHLAFVLGSAIMMIPGGHLGDKFSALKVILVSPVIGFVLLNFLLLNPMLSSMAMLTTLFFLGASIGLTNPLVVALGNQLMPQKPGVVSAFLMGMVWCVAECLGPGGGGILTKFFTDDAPAMALGVLGIFFGIGFMASFPLPTITRASIQAEATSKSEKELAEFV